MATGAGWAGQTVAVAGWADISRSRTDREIHGLDGLVRGLKNLGPHRSITGFNFTVREAILTVHGSSGLDRANGLP